MEFHVPAAEPLVACENLVKIFKVQDLEALALQGLDLTVQRGELMAIIGNSGSGKTTLLNVLGGLDRPSAGTAVVAGYNLLKMPERTLVKYKREVDRLRLATDLAQPHPLLDRLTERGSADGHQRHDTKETPSLGHRAAGRCRFERPDAPPANPHVRW